MAWDLHAAAKAVGMALQLPAGQHPLRCMGSRVTYAQHLPTQNVRACCSLQQKTGARRHGHIVVVELKLVLASGSDMLTRKQQLV